MPTDNEVEVAFEMLGIIKKRYFACRKKAQQFANKMIEKGWDVKVTYPTKDETNNRKDA